MPISEGLYQAVGAGLHSEPAAAELIALLRTIDVVAGTAEAGNALVLDASGGIATIASATITALRTTTITGWPDDLTLDTNDNSGIVDIGRTTADAVRIGRVGKAVIVTSTLLLEGALGQNAVAGAANSVSRIVVRKNAIVDATATSVLTFTCPNTKQGAVCKVTFLAQQDDQDSLRCAEGMVVLSRIVGSNLVGQVATLVLDQIATVGSITLTLAYDMGTVSGAAGAANTIDMRVTLDLSGSSEVGELIVVAEIINAEATGITVAAA